MPARIAPIVILIIALLIALTAPFTINEGQVAIRTEDEQTVQEYRIKGKLYMQRVTPKHGRPYVLMDYNGDGTFVRSDHPTDNGVRVPQWVLKEF